MPLRTLPIGQGVRGKGGEEEKRAGKKRDRDKEQMTAGLISLQEERVCDPPFPLSL